MAGKPLWLWHSSTVQGEVTAAQVDRLWQAFLRRFDLEHTFRFFRQTLGWPRPRPRIRDPQAADRWTWLMIAAYTQLRSGRSLVEDRRRPWNAHRPHPPAVPGPRPPWISCDPTDDRLAHERAEVLPARSGGPAGSRNRLPSQHHEPGRTSTTDIKDRNSSSELLTQ